LKIGHDHRRQLGRGLAIMTITMGGGSGQILLSPFLRSQHKDPVMIGALVAVVAVASLAIRIPGGLLYSRTRARPLLLGSLAMCALAFSLYPVTANPGLLAVIGVVYGTGFSVATTVNMAATIESLRPGENRGRAITLYAAGMSTGYALGSLIGGAAGDHFGFDGAYRLAAGMFLIAVLPLFGRNIESSEPLEASRSVTERSQGWRRAQSFGLALLDAHVLFVILGAFLINVYLVQFNTFLPLTLLPLGFALAQIGLIRSVWSLTNTAGRTLAQPVVSVLGHHRTQHFGLTLQAAMLMLFFLPLPMVALLGVTVAAAWGRAICFVANTLALADIDPRRLSRGVASGVMNAAGDLGNIVGPLVGGILAGAVGLQGFWLVTPPLCLAVYYALLLAIGRLQVVADRPALAT